MVPISRIEPIGTLAEIEKKQLAAAITRLAKKLLPGNGACQVDNRFSLKVLLIIGRLLLENNLIADSAQICCHCQWQRQCQWRNN